jgi:hypothetical protein
MEQDTLRLLIRRKLAQGDLPHDSIPRFWGGPANGEQCDACEEAIRSSQFIMEGISTTNQGLQLHVECFYVWDMERDELARRHQSRP